jgi:hypothetical protein
VKRKLLIAAALVFAVVAYSTYGANVLANEYGWWTGHAMQYDLVNNTSRLDAVSIGVNTPWGMWCVWVPIP